MKQLALPYYKEEWRDIAGYEGKYQISSFGRVKSLPRFIKSGKSRNRKGYRLKKESILQPNVSHNGYLCVCLSNNNKVSCFRINRLVAQEFMPNPDNLPTVDHINRNKIDNRVENLRWADMKLQINNSDIKSRIKAISKAVKQYTKDGIFIAEYKSVSEAERQTGIYHSSISEYCNGKRKSAGGYIWQYANLD